MSDIFSSVIKSKHIAKKHCKFSIPANLPQLCFTYMLYDTKTFIMGWPFSNSVFILPSHEIAKKTTFKHQSVPQRIQYMYAHSNEVLDALYQTSSFFAGLPHHKKKCITRFLWWNLIAGCWAAMATKHLKYFMDVLRWSNARDEPLD